MPNTKSAERRMRSSARKQQRNHSVKSSLHTLEKKYLRAVPGDNKDETTAALGKINSALDKAAKKGVIPKATANRKKSRLALRLKTAK
ncbi:MAG: 30S ribosomal protein S20 [Verrucomicrobia bacterium]|jgi:small subunit ribosomal protein S20|nr:30S ribosomal protein S20 [Verrucomicrobiota bacterium]